MIKFNCDNCGIDGNCECKELSKKLKKEKNDKINNPSYYNRGSIEIIDFIDDQKLGFSLGNCIKYITRANHKHEDPLEDLLKAQWYLNHEIERLKKI